MKITEQEPKKEFVWHATIKRTDNGFIVEKTTGWTGMDEPLEYTSAVFEEVDNEMVKDDSGDLVYAFRNALLDVKEHFGIYNGKYKKYHLDLVIVPNPDFSEEA